MDATSTKPRREISPRAKARMAGACELLEGVTATFGQVIVLDRLVASGDAAATAANLVRHGPLLRLGFASSLVGVGFHLAWALLFYELFRPVNRSVARLALYVVLVGCAVQAAAAVLLLAPLVILGGLPGMFTTGSVAGAFAPPQVQALVMLALHLNGLAFDTYLAFFGLWCVLSGYLVFRSTFMPRALGVLLMISGLGWTLYVSPPLAARLFPFIAVASALGEIPLQLWLQVAGVNPERWREQARAAADLRP